MHQILITESSLRGLLRELLDSDSPINANPVVDPQAAETDPTNQNFIPSNKLELLPALRALVEPVDDDKVPEVYVMVKDAFEAAKEKEKKMKDTTVESIIRNAVRKILIEALPVSPPPKMIPSRRLSSSIPENEIQDALLKGGVAELTKLLKQKYSFSHADAVAFAQARRDEQPVRIPSGVEVKRFQSGWSPRNEEARQKFIEYSNQLRKEFAGKIDASIAVEANETEVTKEQIYTGLREALKDDSLKRAAKRFYDAFSKTYEKTYKALNLQPGETTEQGYELEPDEEFTEEDKNILLDPAGIVNSLGFQETFGENFNNFSQKIGGEILKSLTKKGYFTSEGSKLKDIASQTGESISNVRKISLIALGKYSIAVKSIENLTTKSIENLTTPFEIAEK